MAATAPDSFPALSIGPLLVPGDSLAVIQAHGDEAHDFLQRMLTADVPRPGSGSSVLAGLCTPKGRLLALARVIPQSDSLCLVLPQSIAADTVQRLRMYVLRSKVTLTPREGEWRLLQASGAEAQRGLAAQGLPSPETPDTVLGTAEGILVVRLAGSGPRHWILGSAPTVSAIEEKLSDHLPTGSEEQWRLGEIAAGIPQIEATSRELFIPQMINLDHLGGVSFSKGCFPGQEVVARTHYRGQVKQRMHRATGSGPPPLPGSEIRDPEGGLAGHTVSAVATDGERYSALVSVRERALNEAILTLEGAPIQIEHAPATEASA